MDAFTGHGIGAEFHTYPSIYHFGDHFEGRDDVGVTMQPGMVFTIEPIIVHLNARGQAPTFRTLSDAWTIIANEPLLSAQVCRVLFAKELYRIVWWGVAYQLAHFQISPVQQSLRFFFFCVSQERSLTRVICVLEYVCLDSSYDLCLALIQSRSSRRRF